MRMLKFDEDGVPTTQVSRQTILDNLPIERRQEIERDTSQRHLLEGMLPEEEGYETCSVRKRIPEAEQYFAHFIAAQAREKMFGVGIH